MSWKVQISEDKDSSHLMFRFWRDSAMGRIRVMVPIMAEGKIAWQSVECEEGEEIPPTFMVPRTMVMKGLLDELATAIRNHGGRVKEDPNVVTVQAMENHLTDLQSLIFGSDNLQLSRRGPSFVSPKEEG